MENMINNDSTTKKYKCDSCEKSFRNRKKLAFHSKVCILKIVQIPPTQVPNPIKAEDSIEKSDKKFPCGKCDTTFLYESNYKIHTCLSNHFQPENNDIKDILTTPAQIEPKLESNLDQVDTDPTNFGPSKPILETIRSDNLTQSLPKIKEGSDQNWQIFDQNNLAQNQQLPNSIKIDTEIKSEKIENDYQDEKHETNIIETKCVSNSVKSYECYKCKKILSDKWTLKFHLQALHKGKQVHECDVCEKYFYTEESLIEHLEILHDHICRICVKSFINSEELKLHFEIAHVDGKNPQCDKCGKGFKNLKLLQNHEKYHENDCQICKKSFENIWSLKFHKQTAHAKYTEELNTNLKLDSQIKNARFLKDNKYFGKVPGDLKCKLCTKSFKQRCNLVNHIRKIHDRQNQKPEMCGICGKNCKHFWDLQVHMDTVHKGLKYKCGPCGKTFATKTMLKSHISKLHGDGDICYFCQNCSLEYESEIDFKKHFEKIHSKEDYSYEIHTNTKSDSVIKYFPSNQKLIFAKKSQPPRINLKSYQCVKCDETFDEIDLLNIHVELQHLQEKLEMKSIFRCDFCDETFHDEPFLERHIENFHFDIICTNYC